MSRDEFARLEFPNGPATEAERRQMFDSIMEASTVPDEKRSPSLRRDELYVVAHAGELRIPSGEDVAAFVAKHRDALDEIARCGVERDQLWERIRGEALDPKNPDGTPHNPRLFQELYAQVRAVEDRSVEFENTMREDYRALTGDSGFTSRGDRAHFTVYHSDHRAADGSAHPSFEIGFEQDATSLRSIRIDAQTGELTSVGYAAAKGETLRRE